MLDTRVLLPHGRTARAPDEDLACSGLASAAAEAASAADPSSRSPSALPPPPPPTLADEAAAAALCAAAAAASSSSRASWCRSRCAQGAAPPRKYWRLRAAKSGTACSGGLAMETRSQPMPQSIMRRFVSCGGEGRMGSGRSSPECAVRRKGARALSLCHPSPHTPLPPTCARDGSTSKAPSPPVSTMMFCEGRGEGEVVK